jgi:hypothetical protein
LSIKSALPLNREKKPLERRYPKDLEKRSAGHASPKETSIWTLMRPLSFLSKLNELTCFTFFGQLILLFWTAERELSDVESQIAEGQ